MNTTCILGSECTTLVAESSDLHCGWVEFGWSFPPCLSFFFCGKHCMAHSYYSVYVVLYMQKFSPGENFCQFHQCLSLAKFFSAKFLLSENHPLLPAEGADCWRIKFGEIFVPIQSMSLWRNFSPAKFLSYTVWTSDRCL